MPTITKERNTSQNFMGFLVSLIEDADQHAREHLDGRISYEIIDKPKENFKALQAQFIPLDSPDEEYPKYLISAAGFFRGWSMVQLTSDKNRQFISSNPKLLATALTQ